MAITISGTGITSAQLAADGIDGSKIADDSVDSEHLAADSIDAEHYAAGSVDATALAANSVDSSELVDGSIDTSHFSADCITADEIGDNVINSEHYAAASIDNEHLADDAVGVAELSATGTASSSTFLRGDNAWEAAGGGKVLQVKWHQVTGQSNTTSTSWVTTNTIAITPASGSTLLFIHTLNVSLSYASGAAVRIFRDGTTSIGDQPPTADADSASHFIKTNGVSGNSVHASHGATWFYVHGGDGSTSMSFTADRRMSASSNTSYFQYYGSPSSLTIIEIGA